MARVTEVSRAELRALLLSDEDLANVCTEVLTVLAHGEALVEIVNFNEIDVTVDRPADSVTFQGILSVNDATVVLSTTHFRDLTSSIALPLSGDDLAAWHQSRRRRVWPMPAAAD